MLTESGRLIEEVDWRLGDTRQRDMKIAQRNAKAAQVFSSWIEEPDQVHAID